jgi:alpha-tubulin suppressor-like RCC1 family protein
MIDTEDIVLTLKNNKKVIIGKGELHSNKLDNFQMFKCTAGKNNLIINTNGDVYSCMSHKAKGNPDYNIYKNNKINKSINGPGVLCTFSRCLCEIYLPKVRVL